MRLLIVGLGSIGRRHGENLMALGQRDITVVRSRKETNLGQADFIRRHKPILFYDLNKALQTKPDVVLVTNPTSYHIPIARKAVQAGAHVFIEKPISHTLQGVTELLSLTREKKLLLQVGYHFRHHPHLQKIKLFLDQGILGDLVYARFSTGEYLPDWHPWEDYRQSYAARKRLGGGATLTQSHDLDCASWFFGKPLTTTAMIINTGQLTIDAEDQTEAILQYERCPMVSLHIDYLARPPVKRCEILGSKGRLEWDYHQQTLNFFRPGRPLQTFVLPRNFERNTMYIEELRELLRCLKDKTQPSSTGETARDVLAVALAIKRAAALHKRLPLARSWGHTSL